ncbi:oxidoreductase [Histoplasma capsulatum G186AR]|uniref:Oxidoreductase n=1 Tax=Ajellomyces capsulatus (strain G186AR / H82 / ATCC MYA-2454 / RMSCC 2432) TaxID=447093 RepID=C0NH72_AJECG|nr:oxidoreductase [Histoplasma capsulatum G186AR]EEH09157.1 oxidoreductase [Histoplasma capsulatum G186AR]
MFERFQNYMKTWLAPLSQDEPGNKFSSSFTKIKIWSPPFSQGANSASRVNWILSPWAAECWDSLWKKRWPKLEQTVRYIGRLRSPDAEFLATQDLAGLGTARIFRPTNAVDYSPENMTKPWISNYSGLFMTAQVVARQMMEYECVDLIMLAASMSRLVTIKGLNAPVYTSSKAAAIQLEGSLTRGLELIHCAQGTF